MDSPNPSPSSRSPHLGRPRPSHLPPSFPADPVKPALRRSLTFHRRPAGKLPPPRNAVTIYLTSLQGVRRTYDDCRAVQSILHGFRVAVDERDLAMDLAHRRELQALLGARPFSLPQVFVGRRWIGGADEIRRMSEDGELARALEGVAPADPCFVCQLCGGARFVPCLACGGSRKVFEEDEGLLRRCAACNENGLTRCAGCY